MLFKRQIQTETLHDSTPAAGLRATKAKLRNPARRETAQGLAVRARAPAARDAGLAPSGSQRVRGRADEVEVSPHAAPYRHGFGGYS
jgi:hypothetical protein